MKVESGQERSGTSRAAWAQHLSRACVDSELRGWLIDRVSLTRKLMGHSTQFRVQRLKQGGAVCLGDEADVLGLVRPVQVIEREVFLRCDEVPVVYAHSVVPRTATADDWPFFSSLGNRSLGASLFVDPRISRSELEYARLNAAHPLMRRAARALGISGFDQALWARRCLYRRKRGVLLVTELFLPALRHLTQQTHPCK